MKIGDQIRDRLRQCLKGFDSNIPFKSHLEGIRTGITGLTVYISILIGCTNDTDYQYF